MGSLNKIPATLVQTALHFVALAAFVTLAVTPHQSAGYALVLIGLLMVAARGSETGLLSAVPAVTLLAAAVIAPLPHTWGTSFLAGTIVFVIISQSALLSLGRLPQIRAINLPGYTEPRRLAIPADAIAAANVVVVAAIGAFGYAGWPVWPVTIVTLIEAAAVFLVTAHVLYRRWQGAADSSQLRTALDRHAPRFIVYFSGALGQEHQLISWLPHLDSVGAPYVIVLREAIFVRRLRDHTRAPILYCPAVPNVDATIVPSVRAVVYLNNANLNSHIARFNKLTHIQLLHGDSDKPASFNPVSAMFDRLFVAGPAGIQRYADHGVVIADEKFDVVGRPQAAGIAPAASPTMGNTLPTVANKGATVLYAPTTPGQYADENHCSLPIGAEIIDGLLARGLTVILRGHPALGRRTPAAAQLHRLGQILEADRARSGRKHVFGAEALAMSEAAAMNASDAMISDVSAMAVDYLASGKPLALTDVRGAGPDFTRHSPLARAAYVIDADGGNVGAVLDPMLGADPLFAHRDAIVDHYLAPDTFAATLRRYIGSEPPALASAGVRPRASENVTV